MLVSEAILARYRALLDALGLQAADRVSAAIAYTEGNMKVAPVREAAIEALSEAAHAEGDMAQALAAQLFDEVCELEGIDAKPAQLFEDVIDERWIEEKVHWHARSLIEGNRAKFEGECRKLADFYVKRCAFGNTVRNCDASHVRYARIPTGSETCAWCFMLASRGFVYHSEQSAEHGKHVGCDCIVMPGRKDTEIEGYDQQGMRDRWSRCQEAAGVKDGDSYKERKAILVEAAKRDPEWLLTGTCRATRMAANLEAARVKKLYPDAYADWQDGVSQVGGLDIHPNQLYHILGTRQYDNELRQGHARSYFDMGEGDDFTLRDELKVKIFELAGTGVPIYTRSGKWSHKEIVSIPCAGYDVYRGAAANKATVHYSLGERKLIHIVPRFEDQ